MKSKIVCLLLIFSLLFQNNLTLAMESKQSVEQLPASKCHCVKRSTCALITSLASLLFFAGGSLGGYLIGYKNGQKIKLNSLKDISLEGLAMLDSGDVPDGIIQPVRLAQKYIKDVLRNEIPKLGQDDKFPASKLAAIEYYLRLCTDCGESKELTGELETLSKRMKGFVFHKSKITLGTLTDLINDAQELVDRAYKEIYIDKKRDSNL